VAVVVYLLGDILAKIVQKFRISQKSSFQKILFTSFVGAYSHVFLDSFLYREMDPFYPLQGNPFIGVISEYLAFMGVYGLCSLSLIFGIIIYLYKIRKGTVILG